MTKTEKNALIQVLKSGLATTDQKWDAEGPQTAAFCYGYLIGIINQAITELEK